MQFIMESQFLFLWVGLISAVAVGQFVLGVELAVVSISCTVSSLSHTAVIWLPWFSHIILVRIAHCAIELTGCVPHNCVTLTNAWTAE